MSDQQDLGPWDPYDLITDEHRSILKTSQGIDQAQTRVRTLALKLAYDGPLSRQETQWLINLAYTASMELWPEVKHEEYNRQQRQEASQQIDAVLDELREIPPYEPVSIPDWLQDLQPGGG